MNIYACTKEFLGKNASCIPRIDRFAAAHINRLLDLDGAFIPRTSTGNRKTTSCSK